jgi:hypothetical protein
MKKRRSQRTPTSSVMIDDHIADLEGLFHVMRRVCNPSGYCSA